jgi:hypothetical protein
MGSGRRLFSHAQRHAAGRIPGRLVEFGAPSPTSSFTRLAEMFPLGEPADLDPDVEGRGLADLRAALCMVALGAATSITLCGFADGREQLELGRALAIEGVVVEPLIRNGGGGFDVRVRRISPLEE